MPSRTRTGRAILAHPLITIFVALVVVIGVPVGAVLAEQHRTDQKLEAAAARLLDYQVSSKVDGCRSSNHGRAALQRVLDQAANPPQAGAARIHFAGLAGFDALDPQTKFFLGNLEAALNQPNPSTNMQRIADNYRKSNPSNVDCLAVGVALRRKLEG